MGDDMAHLESLYREHGPGLLAYLQRRCHSRQLAEDVLQETFVEAMRRPDRLREARSPRAWLFVIARNRLATWQRRVRPTQSLGTDDLASPTAQPNEDLQWMAKAITQLPQPMRQALELRLQAELSYEQIADVLDIPVGTVRSRLHHAVQRLRQAFQSEMNHE